MTQMRDIQYDTLLQLKDAGLVAASAAAQVGAVDQILDLGEAFMEGRVVINPTAIEVDTANEKYEIEWQLSDSATFASGIVTATVVKIGDLSVTGSSADTPALQIIQPVNNEFQGTIYRYARLFTRIAGTIGTGINYSAYFTKA